VVVAFAGIDDPLEALEGSGVGDEGVGGVAGWLVRMLTEVGIGGMFPENGLDAAHAAEAPFVVNEGVDELALGGTGGGVLLVILGGEFGEIFFGFVEHNLLLGMDAVF